MIRNIAILTALVGMAGPALGQMSQLSGGLPEIHEARRGAERSLAYADCSRRYRSMRARNQMQPSERQRALALCQAAADRRVWKEQLAKSDR